jgi:hypothetical protein
MKRIRARGCVNPSLKQELQELQEIFAIRGKNNCLANQAFPLEFLEQPAFPRIL